MPAARRAPTGVNAWLDPKAIRLLKWVGAIVIVWILIYIGFSAGRSQQAVYVTPPSVGVGLKPAPPVINPPQPRRQKADDGLRERSKRFWDERAQRALDE